MEEVTATTTHSPGEEAGSGSRRHFSATTGLLYGGMPFWGGRRLCLACVFVRRYILSLGKEGVERKRGEWTLEPTCPYLLPRRKTCCRPWGLCMPVPSPCPHTIPAIYLQWPWPHMLVPCTTYIPAIPSACLLEPHACLITNTYAPLLCLYKKGLEESCSFKFNSGLPGRTPYRHLLLPVMPKH